jgi:hypothetical protein
MDSAIMVHMDHSDQEEYTSMTSSARRAMIFAQIQFARGKHEQLAFMALAKPPRRPYRNTGRVREQYKYPPAPPHPTPQFTSTRAAN